jgi:gliding motility-associated-like protein
MFLRRITLLVVSIVKIACSLSAQIFAPDADYTFDAAYNPAGGSDQVFVFNKPTYQAVINASIRAHSVDSTDGWSFQWSVFNPITLLYSMVDGPVTGEFSQIDTLTVSAGYRVEMTKGTESYQYRVWVLINDMNVEITNKDEADTLLFGYYNCSSLDLRADTTKAPLYYFNPETGDRQNVYTSLIIRWTTDNDEASNPPSKLITRVTSPPWADTWYCITVTDNFGLGRTDSVFYESIQSKASISATYVNLSDSVEYPGKLYEDFYEDNILSAPGKYRFDLSGSENLASYEIDFGDGETLTLGSDSLHLVHEYMNPGTYKVVLTTKSEQPFECIDSVSVEAELVYADKDNFALPNVFTPDNGDAYNNVFRSSDVSVEFVDITIFSRTGLKVHQYTGNIRDWEGWDGTIRNSGRKAPVGVYFYIISRLNAYEDKENPIGKKVMTGYVHLYR